MTATQTATHNSNEIDRLNRLLRGEMSAVETYDQAIAKFSDPAYQTHATTLRRIRDDHQNVVGMLRSRVTTYGGEPSEGSRPWGTFATTVTGTAKLLGPQTTLSALSQGEKHGIEEYERALESDELSTEDAFLVRSQLLPRCQQHVTALDQLSERVEQTA
jgi:hypothetical protein